MRGLSIKPERAGILVAVLLLACDAAGPVAPAQEEDGPEAIARVVVLQRAQPASLIGAPEADWLGSLTLEQQASAVIGPDGGQLSAGGVTLRIPKGALVEVLAISVTVPEGLYVDVRLEPHGLQFQKAAELVFDLHGTIAQDDPTMQSSLLGVYHLDSVDDGMVTPIELLPVTVDDNRATLQIGHFSAYTLAGG